METVPFGLVLSPDYEPHHLTLISIPRGTGELKLLGKIINILTYSDFLLLYIVSFKPLLLLKNYQAREILQILCSSKI